VTPTDRLALSEQVIVQWEAQGQPGGPIDDNVRVIREELTKLLDIAAANPDLSAEIDAVAYRYRLMEMRLKRGLN
jgi:hypothetical protein